MNEYMYKELDELTELEQSEEREYQQFKITDLGSLNWVMRKLNAIEQRHVEVSDIAKDEIARIERYRHNELNKLSRSGDHLRSLVADYMNQQRAIDPKFKSMKTPYGAVAFRKQQPKWHYQEDALMDWLEQHDYGNLIRHKREPSKNEIKAMFTITEAGAVVDANGEIVEGLTIEYREDEITIKTDS